MSLIPNSWEKKFSGFYLKIFVFLNFCPIKFCSNFYKQIMSKQNPNEGNNQAPQRLFGNVEYTSEERLYLQNQLDDKVNF